MPALQFGTGATASPAAGQPSYFSSNPQLDAAQAAVNRYTGGMTVTSNPVTAGSVHNGGIGGPAQTAALNSWQAAQNNAQMLQSFGYRGPQMATNDYAPGGAMYQGQNSTNVGTPAGGGAANPTGPAQTGLGVGASASTPASSGTGATAANATQNNIATIAQAYDEAQRRNEDLNEQRYRDILSGYGSRFDRNMGTLEGMGESERSSINKRYDATLGANLQDAVSRGLTGTTVLPGMKALTERERTQALGDLDERLRRERIGLDTNLSGDTLSFMERREDVGPDLNQMIGLAEALGQAGDNNNATNQGYFDPYAFGFGMPDLSPQYVSNGLDGGAFGQPIGSYMPAGWGGGGGGMDPFSMMMLQAMAGGNNRQPSYMQRQAAAQYSSPAEMDRLRYTPIGAIRPSYVGDVNEHAIDFNGNPIYYA
jgi:hypothetical protein